MPRDGRDGLIESGNACGRPLLRIGVGWFSPVVAVPARYPIDGVSAAHGSSPPLRFGSPCSPWGVFFDPPFRGCCKMLETRRLLGRGARCCGCPTLHKAALRQVSGQIHPIQLLSIKEDTAAASNK